MQAITPKLPRTVEYLCKVAINYDDVKNDLCRAEVRCPGCDIIICIARNKASFSEESANLDRCAACSADIYVGVDGFVLPLVVSYAFPLDQQFQLRLNGMYLQDIIDASVMLDTGFPNLDPDYFSGDTTDSQKARMLRSDNNMRIDLTNRKDAKVYIMYTISSDAHDPMATFNYSLWTQWLTIHNQPIARRTWGSRAFLMKCTTNGDKPTDMNSHLEFSVMWVHKLATTGVPLGKRDIFVGDPNRSGARELVHFENVTLHGYLLNYNGDCIDLTQVMNCMGAANANCCLPFSNLSAVRISPRHLSFSASLLLKREEFQVKSSAESEAHVKIVEDSKGTPNHKTTCQQYGAKGKNVFYTGCTTKWGLAPENRDATLPWMYRQGCEHKQRIHAKNILELCLNEWKGDGTFWKHIFAEHNVRQMWRGSVTFYSFFTTTGSGLVPAWSRFRIRPAIDYILNWILVDFDVPAITNNRVAKLFFVCLYKFYKMLEFPGSSPILTDISNELIQIHLICKELLFGLKKSPRSSSDLMLSPHMKQFFGPGDLNSELGDDKNFKTCNKYFKRFGNVDYAQQFKDAYLQMLALGQASDFAHEKTHQQRLRLGCGEYELSRPIGINSVADEIHQFYAGLFPLELWQSQMPTVCSQFLWENDEELDYVTEQVLRHNPDDLQFFEQMKLRNFPKGRHFNPKRLDKEYQRQAIFRSVSGARSGSAIAIKMEAAVALLPATALEFACVVVENLRGERITLPLVLADTYEVVGTASFEQVVHLIAQHMYL